MNIYLIRRFSVKYRWVFLRASCTVFWPAREASQNANKEWRFLAILHTKTFKKLFIIQFLYFKRISCKTGKVKQKEKRSTRSRPDKQIFLQDKTINLPISRDIFVQFARYLYPAKCSWLKNIFLIKRLGVQYRWVFLRVVPLCESEIQRSKNAGRYNTSKRLISYLLSNCIFSC